MTLNPWRLQLLSSLDALGTVRAVAAAAHLSPSTVSEQLAVLEGETRSRLLERTGRRVRLTPAGQLLARRARELLDHMGTVEAELAALAGQPVGRVRVGALQSAVHSLVVPALDRLAAAHPDLDTEIRELEPHAGLPALLGGEVDLLVTTTDHTDHAVDPTVEAVPLLVDPIVLVVPRGHRLAGAGPVELARCAEEPWALDVPGSTMDGLATRLCRRAGFEPRVACRINNYLVLLQHVEAGRSVALLPRLAVDPRYDVVGVGLAEPVTRRVTAAMRTNSASRAAVGATLAALRGD